MILNELFESRHMVSEEEILRMGGFNVRISPHVKQRAQEHSIPAYLINTLLARLKKIKSTIKKLDPYEQFRVLDTQTGVVLGMMRSGEDPDKILFNTVFIDDDTTPKRDPVIVIR